MQPLDASAAVLLGGKSTRMGQDKALLPFGDRPLIEVVVRRLQAWFPEVLLITNRPEPYAFLGLRTVSDRLPGAGPLAGLESALSAARHDAVFIQACDLPFVSRPVVEHLVERSRAADAAVPRYRDEWEPLCAVYRRSCLPVICAALERGERRVLAFFPQVQVAAVAESELSPLANLKHLFFNVNTPDDYRQAERLVAAPEGT